MADNVKLERVYVWYSPDQDNIHISCDDPRIVDAGGKRRGLNIAVSREGKPSSFGHLTRLLRSEGMSAPDDQ